MAVLARFDVTERHGVPWWTSSGSATGLMGCILQGNFTPYTHRMYNNTNYVTFGCSGSPCSTPPKCKKTPHGEPHCPGLWNTSKCFRLHPIFNLRIIRMHGFGQYPDLGYGITHACMCARALLIVMPCCYQHMPSDSFGRHKYINIPWLPLFIQSLNSWGYF